jgi:type III secretion protein W
MDHRLDVPMRGGMAPAGLAEAAARQGMAARIAGQALRLSPTTPQKAGSGRAGGESAPSRPQRVRSCKTEGKAERSQKVTQRAVLEVRRLPDMERNRKHFRYLRMLQVRIEAMTSLDHEVVRAVAQQCFDEPAQQYTAMKFAREVLQEDGKEEATKALDKAMEQLERESGPQIKAGRNISEGATPFVDKGLGTFGQLRQMYCATVVDYHNVGQAFVTLKKLLGTGDFDAAVQFLTVSIGADLGSREPSCDRTRLESVVNDFYQIRFLDGFHQEMMQLMARLKAQYQLLNPFTDLRLTERVLMLVNQEFVNPDDVRQLPREAGCTERTAVIYFLTQMHGKIRLIPVKIFNSDQPRDLLLGTFQMVLDEKIKEEEAGA